MLSKENLQEVYPLTPMQEGLFFHALYEPDSLAYLQQITYCLRGALDVVAFETAWNQLIQRHDVLRTVFIHRHVPKPLQFVLKHRRLNLSFQDLRNLDPAMQHEAIQNVLQKDRSTPFDLSRDVLMRLQVLQTGDAVFRVVWSFHHIIMDGWCLPILQQELMALYSGQINQNDPNLPVPGAFRTFVEWLEKQDRNTSREFWQNYLEGYDQLATFPKQAPTQAYDLKTVSTFLDVDTTRALRQLASQNRVTLNVVVQALWAVLLAKTNDVEDVVFGIVVSGRPYEIAGVEHIVGLFINTVPLRVHAPSHRLFSEILTELMNQMASGMKHHFFPLADIQANSPLKQGLFDHILTFDPNISRYPFEQAAVQPEQQMPPSNRLILEHYENIEQTHYPLEIAVGPGEQLRFTFRFNARVYSVDQIEAIQRHLREMITSVLAYENDENSGIDVKRISILSESEKNQLMTGFNQTDWPYPQDQSIVDVFESQAVLRPDAPAIISNGQSLTYSNLHLRAARIGYHLQAAGVLPKDRVGVLLDRSENMVAAILGILYTGAAYIPIDPAFPQKRVDAILTNSHCKVLLTQVNHLSSSVTPRIAIPEGTAVCFLDAALSETVSDEGTPRPSALDPAYVMYTSGSTGQPKGVVVTHENVVSFNANMTAVFGFKPMDRILALTTISFDISVLEILNSLMTGLTVVISPEAEIREPKRILDIIQEQEVTALQLTPSRLRLLLENEYPVSSGIPAALRQLQVLLIGGEPLPLDLFELIQPIFDSVRVFNVYGPTEATIWSMSQRLMSSERQGETGEIGAKNVPSLTTPRPLILNPINIGSPLKNEQVYVLSRDLNLMPIGSVGEICIAGKGLAQGYFELPEQTAAAFIDHPFAPGKRLYKTGDFGYWQPDGTLVCLGRRDDQVKIRGYRIETGDIESHIKQFPDVPIRDAVVIAWTGSVTGPELAAYLVCSHPLVSDKMPAQALNDELRIIHNSPFEIHDSVMPALQESESGQRSIIPALREFLRQLIPDYMIPSHFVQLERLPLTPNGKVNKKALPDPRQIALTTNVHFSTASGIPCDALSPGTAAPQCGQQSDISSTALFSKPDEARIAGIWQQILERPVVSIHDNFFDLGGHSLKAMRMVSAIHREMGVEISLQDIFAHPTVFEIAKMLRSKDAKVLNKITHGPVQAHYPLSHAQRRLWVLHCMNPESPAYNMPGAFWLNGQIEPNLIRQAFELIVDRHESLRTVFRVVDGEPRQVIQSSETVLEMEDMRSRENPVHAAITLIRQLSTVPFDLSTGPLFRVMLIRTGKSQYLLFIHAHHIVCDAWSMDILAREMAILYMTYVGTPECRHIGISHSNLPPLPIQYRDYALWQQGSEAGAQYAEDRKFWHSQLLPLPEPLDFPLDFPRPATPSYKGHTLRLPLEPSVFTNLRTLAGRYQTTPFILLVSSVKVLLHRYTGQTEITLGTAASGRTHPDLEHQVGFFANILTLRDSIDPQKRFDDLATQIRETVLLAHKHQRYPFDQLVDELKPVRDQSRAPVFDVMVVIQQYVPTSLAVKDMSIQHLALDTGTSRFDMTFEFIESLDGLSLNLSYCSDLFSPDTIQRIADHWQRLLTDCLTHPQKKIHELEMLSEPQQQQVLVDFNAPALSRPVQEWSLLHLTDVFARAVDQFPDSTAVIDADGILTYRELDHEANVLANMLRTRFQGHDDLPSTVNALVATTRASADRPSPDICIGVMLGRSRQLIIAILGILKAGATYLPIDPDYPIQRIQYMVSDSNCQIILIESAYESRLPLFPHIQTLRIPEPILSADQLGTEPETTQHTLLGQHHPGSAAPQCGQSSKLRQSHDLMYVIYTSGSTGQPKGVMIQHDGFLNMIQTQIDVFGILPHDRVLQFASPGFDASLSEIFMALLCGAAVVMIPDAVIRDPYTFLQFMTDYQVTVATLPPAYLHVLPRVDMSPLRVLITAGEAAIAEDLVFHSRSRTVFNAYGPTEASVCAAIYRLDSNALVAATRASAKTEAGDIPIGQPLPGAPVYLLSKGYSGALVSAMGPEDKPAIPIGVSGEICIAGIGLARGYMNRPDLTAEKFISHPYLHSQRLYRSGDMGKWRADGQLVFLGRIDDQIKVRGFRIEPNEIASALRSHPQVKDAAVMKWSLNGETDELLAFVQFVMDTGMLLQTAGAGPNACPPLQNYLAERLPRYCLPDRIIPVDMLQLTPSGKIDRQALLAVAAKSESRKQRQVAAPSNDLEKILLEAFSSVLGKKELNMEADFFDWGGNSLKAIRLSTLLCDQLKQEIPVRMIFLHPTVAQLVAMLQNKEQGAVKNNQTIAPCQETHGPPPYGPEADSQLLDASFTPPPWPQSWPDSRAIFLTGASGFLGAFLLAELLEQTHATLYCLVRCSRPEDGMARLISKLKTVDLWHPEYERRIAPIPGDLAKPLFGLDPRTFSELGQCLDMIYHNGALVDFLQPYQRLRAENVLGTQTILNLATIGPAKRLHFVSTLSVFPKQGQGLSNGGRDGDEGSGEKSFASNDTVFDARIDEQDPPAHWIGLETGYDQSKWAAEKLVLAARDKGLAVTIFRPGRITGHSQSGLSDPQSLFVRSLRGYIELNMVSDRYADEDMTPVDFAAKALVVLSLKPDAIGKIFHLINPQPMPAPLILSCLQQAGYKLDIVPDSQWRERMVAKLEMQPHNPLYPFLPLIKELPASVSVQRFGCSNTLKYLAGTGVVCPPADAALFRTYLKYITG